jgi:hypothetical protein
LSEFKDDNKVMKRKATQYPTVEAKLTPLIDIYKVFNFLVNIVSRKGKHSKS